MVNQYPLIKITIPGVYYKTPNKTANDKIQKLKGITSQLILIYFMNKEVFQFMLMV